MPDNEIVVVQQAMMRAEIDSQISTAKAYPRDISVFKDKLMAMANIDQETAESCYYALPRGNKPIEGPSVRLAEIALSCYGNCVAESNIVSIDENFITAMGQCRDLENNVSVRINVSKRITKADSFVCTACKKWHKYMPDDSQCMKCGKESVVFKKGERYNDDMIVVTSNAACSVAFRNAVFKVIPGAFIKPVFERVKQTAVGNVKSLVKRRSEVMAQISQFGVTEDRILAVLKRNSVGDVTFKDVGILIGIGQAIRDGDLIVENAFPLITFDGKKVTSAAKKKEESGSEIIDADTIPEDNTGNETGNDDETEDWQKA